MTYPLGVDIGTTYTAAALWRDGRVQSVPLGNRADAVPSVLFLREDNSMLVGEAASRRGILDPDRQAREFKRRMGDDIPILVGGRGYTAAQLTAEVLRWTLQRVAELQGGPPQHVVLTHPAAWGDYRKNLLIQAARACGLREVGLLPEPVAAATWYAAQERIDPGSLIGIYDFGGGTFDASVVRKTATGVEIHGEAGGDDSIGGIDFDHALFRHVGAAAGVDVGSLDMADPVTASAMAQLFAAVVEAKEALSADSEVVLPVVLPGVSRQVLVTRPEFEDLIRQRVLGTVGVFGQVVRRAGIDPGKLHGVLLVGGSSRIPLVRQLLSAELGIRVAVDAHPKYTVSLGAAIAAAPRAARAPGGFAPLSPPGSVRPMPPPPVQHHRPPPARYPVSPPSGFPMPGRQSVRTPFPNGPQAPAVSEKVDLARSGLTGITDVRAVLASIQPLEPVRLTPPPRDNNPVTSVRTTEGGTGRGRLIALLVVLVIAAVVAVLVLVVLDESSTEDAGTPAVRNGSAAVEFPAVGKITLSGRPLVLAPDGTDKMLAVTALQNATVVAVGASQNRQPRAWVAKNGGEFTAADVPVDQQGEVLDVVGFGSTAVAVGWTGVGPANRAAVWTSSDGGSWNLLPPQGDFNPPAGIKRLTAVTVGPDGRLLAIGRDDRVDRADGDSAVYTSPDGRSWTMVSSSGLSGSGPQDVARLVRSADSSLVALGSVLQGAKRGPSIWTSKDGVKWDSSPYLPQGAPSLDGIAKLADDRLLVCGSIGSGEPPPLSCWTQKPDQQWERWDVTSEKGTPRAFFLYGMYSSGDQVTVVGLGQSTGGDGRNLNDAAMWTIAFGPRG